MKQRMRSWARANLPVGVLRFLKTLRLAFNRARYYGHRYRCPICRSRLRTFLPGGAKLPVLEEQRVVGAGYRDYMFCPACNSTDRERLLYLLLTQKKGSFFPGPMRLLHVAPEAGLSDFLGSVPGLEYLTADLNASHVQFKMDLTQIEFPEASVDAIICNHVLEHIIDDRKAMAELYRVLKPGGWAILQVPVSLALEHTYEDRSITDPEGRQQAFGQWDHVRLYARDYQDRLASAGFEVTVIDAAGELEDFGGPANVFGINPDESVYVATKR